MIAPRRQNFEQRETERLLCGSLGRPPSQWDPVEPCLLADAGRTSVIESSTPLAFKANSTTLLALLELSVSQEYRGLRRVSLLHIECFLIDVKGLRPLGYQPSGARFWMSVQVVA
jgi:hypothetical protein